MGQGDGVVVELEGVGVGKSNGKNRHVLIVVKTGKHLISLKNTNITEIFLLKHLVFQKL